jgi:predicted deacylase
MSTLRCTVDFDAEGKHTGVLFVPDANNENSAWGSIAVPIACIRNGSGPTVVLSAGNHGDEYEGQLALRRIVAETGPGDVRGRLIVLPCLSVSAAKSARRLWPDGTNFNRAFPGSPTGRAHELLADFLSTELFPRADVVGDFHSGGRSLNFPPMASMHLVDDPEQRRKMVDAALALNTDWLLVYVDVTGGGLLPGEVERQGKVMVSAELGGGGIVTPETVHGAHAGIVNVARSVGVLAGDVVSRAELGKPPTRVVSATDPENYVLAPASGLFDPTAPFGAAVDAGDELGRIYTLDELEREPRIVTAPTAGIVVASRPLPIVTRGDCVALVAQEVDADVLRG